MPREKILIVEDDKHISKLVEYNLQKAGYEPVAVEDGEEALDFLERHNADLIILDIMLPEIDGLEVCRRIKQDPRHKNTPIVMLTAKGEEVDRIVGLELGADDYIVKPFSPRELVLRIKAILKRGKTDDASGEIIIRGNLVINIPEHRVTLSNKEIELTPVEFKLLVTLIERKGRIQSRGQLLSSVWDRNTEVFTRTVDTHIKRLREKLGEAGSKIETVRGMGYRFRDDED